MKSLYENNTTQDIKDLIFQMEEKVTTLETWLNLGDYTEREYPAMKNDIKRYKELVKKLEKVLDLAYDLEIAL